MFKGLVLAAAALAVIGCTAPDTNGDMIEDENQSPDIQIVGNDRDDHNCIPSAGYQWSAVQAACIRIWEQGVEMIHQGSGDPNFSAYALFNTDRSKAEVFLPDARLPLILKRQNDDSWQSSGNDYVLAAGDKGLLFLTDDSGIRLYAQDSDEDVSLHSVDDNDEAPVKGRGVVMQVEDGAYPMYSLLVRLDGEQKPRGFSLNAAGADIGDIQLGALTGETIDIEYDEVSTYDLMGIGAMGSKKVENMESQNGWYFAEGRLEGADEISGGDLPDVVTLYATDGAVIEFDYYIDPDMQALNGKDVSAWFAPREYLDVTAIRVVAE